MAGGALKVDFSLEEFDDVLHVCGLVRRKLAL